MPNKNYISDLIPNNYDENSYVDVLEFKIKLYSVIIQICYNNLDFNSLAAEKKRLTLIAILTYLEVDDKIDKWWDAAKS